MEFFYQLKNKNGVREARTLDLRITRYSYETYALANCATTPYRFNIYRLFYYINVFITKRRIMQLMVMDIHLEEWIKPKSRTGRPN